MIIAFWQTTFKSCFPPQAPSTTPFPPNIYLSHVPAALFPLFPCSSFLFIMLIRKRDDLFTELHIPLLSTTITTTITNRSVKAVWTYLQVQVLLTTFFPDYSSLSQLSGDTDYNQSWVSSKLRPTIFQRCILLCSCLTMFNHAIQLAMQLCSHVYIYISWITSCECTLSLIIYIVRK